MSKQEIQISSVKLINGGLKGIAITYLRINDVKDTLWKSEVTEKNHRPIVGTELLTKFDEFATYITEINSVIEGNVTVTGITASHNKFLLSGTIDCLGGKKKSATNTPCVTEADGYERWEEVQEKVDEIYKMILEYMEKDLYTATNEQMILNFNKGKEGFDAEAVKNMSVEEQVAEATKLLEKIGCVVMNPNEEDMPGGVIDGEEVELKDISAGDEKHEMFETKEEVKKNVEELSHQLHPTIDIDKANIGAEKLRAETERKQKAKEQLAKLKEAQANIEQSIDEDDDFIPMRKVM